MNLPDPRVGQIYTTVGLPDFPPDKPRYIIATAPADNSYWYFSPLTTDGSGRLEDGDAIRISPQTHPSLYRSWEVHHGLPPKSGAISLRYYNKGVSAIFKAEVKTGTYTIITENDEFATLLEATYCRASRDDWGKIRASCPAEHQNFFADYDSLG